MTVRPPVAAAAILAVALCGVGVHRLEQERQIKKLMLTPIEEGDTPARVRALLGDPTSVESKAQFTGASPPACGAQAMERWTYTKSSFNRVIYFDDSRRVLCAVWVLVEV